MTNLNQKFGEVLDKTKKPYPQGGIYWDLGLIQQGCNELTKQLIKELLTKLKLEYDLKLEIDDYIKENYQ